MTTHRWALLVATQHGKAAAAGMTAEARRAEMRQLMARAKSLSSPLRTLALITDRFESEWRDMAEDLPPYNLLVDSGSTSPLLAVEQALNAIRAREADCSVILIPADHCAAVESDWVLSAREALNLAAMHRDIVYLLHDKPQDPLPFEAATDMCSSTVVVGSTDSLIDLCHGNRPTRLIELTTLEQSDGRGSATAKPDGAVEDPIRVVRIRSVEEYARLQRGEYTRAPSVIDVRA
jgi:hypothetical protein